MRALAVVIALAACGHPAPPARTVHAQLSPSGPELPPPPPVAASVRGAAYLTAVAAHLQPAWGQFLEDCRLRLPGSHPLNVQTLATVAELAIDSAGQVQVHIITGSGNGDFDTAAYDVIGDAHPLPQPPAELTSDDERVHLRWLFARDGRQAGPATAQVIDFQLPLVAAVERQLARHAIGRAVQRALVAPQDPDRVAATERIMIEVLREGLGSNGEAQRAAVAAIGRARVHALAVEVHRYVLPTAVDAELRLAAIVASGALGDPAVVPRLLADLPDDLASRPRIALAKIAALSQLHHAPDAAPVIRATLEHGPMIPAVAALRWVSMPELEPKLTAWAASKDPGTRAAVCTALPDAAPSSSGKLVVRGLADADANVRASCIDAVGRALRAAERRVIAIDPILLRRLRDLARDRDQRVRARAVGLLGAIEPGRLGRAVDDPAAEVRAAAVVGAPEAELRSLSGDRDPEVRAAAIAALGERAPDLAAQAIADNSAQVRMAAVAGASDTVLERLVTDASPDVASAAAIAFTGRRGRAAVTTGVLETIAAAPSGSPERVRFALAWLLAR